MESVTCPIVQGFTGSATISHVQGEDKWLRLWVQTNPRTLQTVQHYISEVTSHLDMDRGFLHQCQVPLQAKVFARSTHDGKWHRGLVMSWPPGNNIRDVAVQLYDYGRTEYVDANFIRRMEESQHQQLNTIPPSATECWLSDAWPVNGVWPKEAIDIAVNFVNSSNPVRINGVGRTEGQPLIQVFSETPPMNLSNILIQQGFAIQPMQRQQSPPFRHVSPPFNHSPPILPPAISRMTLPQQSQTTIRYTCTNLELGLAYRVHVSHVEGPHLFFIQLVSRDTECFILSQQITAHVRSNATVLSSLTPRTPCLAFLQRDNAFARALILQPTGDGVSFNVHFVDVGCSDKQAYSTLLAIPPELVSTFVLAYECQLSVVLPDPAMMPQVVAGKVFDCQVMHKNGSRLVVSLGYQGKDISELCRPPQPVAMVRALSPPQPMANLRYSLITLPREYRYNVVVTFVNSPLDLFAQLLDNAKPIDDQLNEMTVFYSSQPVLYPEISESQCFVGMSVAAQFVSDDSWYRGEIIQVLRDGKVEVLYIDFGNTQVVPIRELRRLLPKFKELPKQALRLSLTGFENVNLSSKDNENFESQVLNKGFTMEIKDFSNERYTVALYFGPPSNQLLSRVFLNVTTKVSVVVPTVDLIEKLFVTVFNSVEDFSGQLSKFGEEEFSLFSDQLHTFYESLPLPGQVPFQVDDMVATKYLDSFYRAKILSMKSPKVEVLFVDFGNKETVNESEMFPLSPRFSHLPQQSISCRFASEEVNKISKEKLEEFIFNQTIELQVLGSQGGRYQVKLTQGAENTAVLGAINSIPLVVDYLKPSMRIGFRCEVVVTDVTSSGCICCQLQGQMDELTAMMEKLEQHYKNLAPQDLLLKNASVGCTCVAKFSEDDSWYRARVLTIQRANNLKVLFVDYGNSEDTPASGVKLLAPQFSSLPYQAVEFVLVCVPDSFWTPDTVQKAKTFLTEKFSLLSAHIHGEKAGLQVYEVDLLDEQGNNVGQQLLKENKPAEEYTKAAPAYTKTAPAPVVSDDWNEEPNGGLANGNLNKRDNFNRTASNSRDNFRNNNSSSFLSRNDSSTDTFDKPRGRFGGFDDPDDKPRGRFGGNDSSKGRFGGNDSSKGRFGDNDSSKGRFDGNDDGGFKSRDNNRFGSNDSKDSRPQKIGGDRNSKPWENKNQPKDSFQKRDYCGSNSSESSQSFGPKVKMDSPVKAKVEAKPFGTFLEVKPMSCADVSVEHMVSPGEFYCHLVENSDAFLTLLESMDEYYSKAQGISLLNFNKGSVCCAQSSEDSAWYRARVQETKGLTVDVLFVDYGNVENVPQNKVKELNKEFHPLPIQALKCSLINLAPEGSDWHPDDMTAFRQRLLNQTMIVRFRKCLGEGSYQIQVIEAPGSVNMMNDLKHIKVVSESDPLRQQNLTAGSQLVTFLPEANSEDTVQITWVVNPTVVKCQRQSLMDPFKKMMDTMQTFYNELPDGVGLVEKPKVGMYCVAQFTEDNAWYRGQVKKVRGGKVDVHYVDYGNSEEVIRHRVRYLASDFSSVPCHAIECHLSGIFTLKELNPGQGERFFEGDFSCSFLSYIGDAAIVQLINASGKDLAAELVTAGICAYGAKSQTESFPPSRPPPGSVTIYISHVDNPDSIFVQFSAQEEELTKMTDKILEQIPNCVALTELKVGDACCAIDSDEAYYRAIIIRIEGNETVVRFVDFGNCNTVASSTLLRPPAALLSQAPFAFHCSLKGIAACQGSEAEATTFFTELTIDKSLTAVVMAGGRSGASFSVTLSDDEGELTQRLLSSGHFMEVIDPALEVSMATAKFPAPAIPTDPQVCYVSSVASLKGVFLQLANQEHALLSLAVALNSAYGVGGEPLPNPAVGTACCALFSEDGAWYRAKITSVQGDKATVLFVDYGNSEVVDVSSLKSANTDALSVPPFALECQLGRLVPLEGKESESLDLLTTLTTDKGLTASFQKDPVCLRVSLTSEEDGDITAKLLKSGLVTEEVIPTENLVSTPLAKFPSPAIPTEPQVCYVSSVASLKGIFLQLANQEDALTALADTLNSSYGVGGEPLPNPAVGTACCALFSEDGAWYRAKITSVQGDKTTVLFVDYGNSEVVDISSLKSANADTLSVPPFAFECQLGRLVPLCGKESEIVDLLTMLTTDKGLTASFIKDPVCLRVSLTSEEDGDLAAILLESRLVTEAVIPMENLASSAAKFPPLNIPAEPEVCYVSSVTSLQSLFVQLASQEDALIALADGLNASYASGGQPLLNPTVGVACCSLYSEDNAWYRAQIVSIQDDKATVLFVDYGNSEVVDVSTLKIANADALSVSPFSFECRLGLLVPLDGKETEILDLLTTLTKDKVLTASFFKDPVCLRVSLTNEEDGDLAAKLLESGFVTEDVIHTQDTSLQGDAKFPAPAIPTEPELCYVSEVSSLQSLFLQLVKQEDALTLLEEELNAYYGSGGEPLPNPAVGSICCACYSIDGAWYRAQIISIQDGKATVLFVDYGNCDIVEVTSLKMVNMNALSVAPFAIECCLDHLMPSSGKDAEVLDLLTSLTTDKELTATFVKEALCIRVSLTTEDDGDFATKFLESKLATQEGVVAVEENIPAIHEKELFIQEEEITLQDSDAKILEISPVTQAEQPVVVPLQDLARQAIIPSGVQRHLQEMPPLPVAIVPSEASCFVSSCETAPIKFYLQLANQSKELERLVTQVAEMYSELTDVAPLNNPQPGYICCAQYSIDEGWYRSRILSLDGDTAEVIFIDYGNRESLLKKSLRVLDTACCQQAPFALECSLKDVEVIPGQEVAAQAAFDELTEEQELSVTFHGGQPLAVSLSTKNGDLLERLVRDGMCLAASKLVIDVQEKGEVDPTNKVAAPESASTVTLSLPPCIAPTGEQSCYLSVPGEEAGRFFLKLANQEDALMEFQVHLNEIYSQSTDTTPLGELTVCGLCAALFTEDQQWYRGRIVGVQEDKATVLFVDYGNKEVIAKEFTRSLTEAFLSQAPFAFECSLGLSPASGEEETSLQAFLDLTKDKDLTVTFAQYSEDSSSAPFRVTLLDQDGDLTQRLLDSGLVLNSIQDDLVPETTEVVLGELTYPKEQERNNDLILFEASSELKENVLEGNGSESEVLRSEKDESHEQQSGSKIMPALSYQTENILLPEDGTSNTLKEDLSEQKMCEEEKGFRNVELLETDFNVLEVEEELTCGDPTVPISIKMQPDHMEEVESVCVKEISPHVISTMLTNAELPSIQMKQFYSNDLPTVSVSVGRKVRVQSSNAVSPHLFWLQLADNVACLNSINEEMVELYIDFQEDAPVEVEPGQLYAITFSNEVDGYRCRIETVEAAKVTVFYLDYGTYQEVDQSSLRRLLPELLYPPAQAIACRLADVQPPDHSDSWTEDTCEAFKEMIMGDGKLLIAEFLEETGDEPALVRLLDVGMDVSNKLVQESMAITICKDSSNTDSLNVEYSDTSRDLTDATPLGMVTHSTDISSFEAFDFQNISSIRGSTSSFGQSLDTSLNTDYEKEDPVFKESSRLLSSNDSSVPGGESFTESQTSEMNNLCANENTNKRTVFENSEENLKSCDNQVYNVDYNANNLIETLVQNNVIEDEIYLREIPVFLIRNDCRLPAKVEIVEQECDKLQDPQSSEPTVQTVNGIKFLEETQDLSFDDIDREISNGNQSITDIRLLNNLQDINKFNKSELNGYNQDADEVENELDKPHVLSLNMGETSFQTESDPIFPSPDSTDVPEQFEDVMLDSQPIAVLNKPQYPSIDVPEQFKGDIESLSEAVVHEPQYPSTDVPEQLKDDIVESLLDSVVHQFQNPSTDVPKQFKDDHVQSQPETLFHGPPDSSTDVPEQLKDNNVESQPEALLHEPQDSFTNVPEQLKEDYLESQPEALLHDPSKNVPEPQDHFTDVPEQLKDDYLENLIEDLLHEPQDLPTDVSEQFKDDIVESQAEALFNKPQDPFTVAHEQFKDGSIECQPEPLVCEPQGSSTDAREQYKGDNIECQPEALLLEPQYLSKADITQPIVHENIDTLDELYESCSHDNDPIEGNTPYVDKSYSQLDEIQENIRSEQSINCPSSPIKAGSCTEESFISAKSLSSLCDYSKSTSNFRDSEVESEMPDSSIDSRFKNGKVESGLPDNSIDSTFEDSKVEFELPDSSGDSTFEDSKVESEFPDSSVDSTSDDSKVESVFLDSFTESNVEKSKLGSTIESKLEESNIELYYSDSSSNSEFEDTCSNVESEINNSMDSMADKMIALSPDYLEISNEDSRLLSSSFTDYSSSSGPVNEQPLTRTLNFSVHIESDVDEKPDPALPESDTMTVTKWDKTVPKDNEIFSDCNIPILNDQLECECSEIDTKEIEGERSEEGKALGTSGSDSSVISK